MGLDSVEILVKVEKTFGIDIPNLEAEKIATVGDFHDAVWRHITNKQNTKCTTQLLFYRLRKAVIETFDYPKQQFHLEASVNDIFPKRNRRTTYLKFANDNKLKLPALVLPTAWSIFLTTIGITAIMGALILSIILINFFGYSKLMMLMPVAAVALTYFIAFLLTPKRTVVEPATVRRFVQQVMAINYASLNEGIGSNKKDVEVVINHIIADMAGLDINEVTPEKSITNDLGID